MYIYTNLLHTNRYSVLQGMGFRVQGIGKPKTWNWRREQM
jgi:hypothetical protein